MSNRIHWGLVFLLFCLTNSAPALSSDKATLPDGFVDLGVVIPGIFLEMRYATDDNFVGARIDGYIEPRCILTAPAAQAVASIQNELRSLGFALKVFDCYRPQRAVDHFVRWAEDVNDLKMKKQYYPDVEKKDLFAKSYIAAKSSHSRGSTIDLTLVSMGANGQPVELDMGTGFDLFGPQSWPDAVTASPDQRAHRLLLQTLMKKYGFVPYPEEWWHFTYKEEPFPETYFNFPVQ